MSRENNHQVIIDISSEELFEQTVIGMLLLSPQGIILSANRAANELFGLKQELAGMGVDQLVYTDPSFDFIDLFNKFRKNKEKARSRIYQLGINKENSFWATINLSALDSASTPEPVILCQIQNISEYKEASDEKDYKNHLLFELINGMPDNIFIKDRESKFILANASVAKTMGSDPVGLIGKSDFDFFPKKLAAKYRKDELDVIQSGKPKINITEQVIDIDHNIRWYSTSKLPLKNSKGEIIGIMGVGRDITQIVKEKKVLKKAKYTAEKADRLKTAFLSNLSHEIRTPLNGILGFSQFLKETGMDNPKAGKYLDYIMHNGNRLLNLITDIIDISKIDTRELKLNPKEFNINDLIYRLEVNTKELLNVSDKEQITLNVTIPKLEKPVLLHTDDQRLAQILQIFLSNAVKFTDRGTISLSYTLLEDKIKFVVSDTGIGIERKHFTQIFDRFMQADNTVSRQYEGVGLGLSIAKELAKLLKGEIELKSTVNRGSDFSFTMPLQVTLDTDIVSQ